MAALPADLRPASPAQPERRSPDGRRHLRLAPRRRRSGRYVVLMLAVTALGVFGAVTLNALAAEQSFAARELQSEVDELRRTADELTVEVTRLESPARLHRVARRRLGMVRAQQPAFVMLPGAASPDSQGSSRTMTASVSGG